MFYLSKTDEETDRNGVVFVSFKGNADMSTFNFNDIRSYANFTKSMPIRFVCMHKCVTEKRSGVAKFMDLCISLLPMTSQARTRVHEGKY